MTQDNLKLLFIINPISGNHATDWAAVISNYFASTNHVVELYHITKGCGLATIKERIKLFSPNRVIAVGGDGTIKLVAECLIQTKIPLGILPAGSANGLAKELGISNDPIRALNELINGHSKKIHLTYVNEQLCIHLSDIGLNAYAMKKFKTLPGRGMWGYFIASLKVLWQNPVMEIKMQIDEKIIKTKASMIVIANATKYGTGAVINPIGSLYDAFFEVIVVKKVSIREIFKMVFSHEKYDIEKTEVFQTNAFSMKSRKKVHFQIDGEYLGRVNEVNAIIATKALRIIVPNV